MAKFRSKSTGQVVEARDANEARALFNRSKKYDPNEKGLRQKITDRLVGEKVSKFLNTPILPKFDTGSKVGNFLYNDLIADSTSIAGAAEGYLGGKAIGAVGKGLWKVFGKGVSNTPGLVSQAAAALPQKAGGSKLGQAAQSTAKAAQNLAGQAAVTGNTKVAASAMKAGKVAQAAANRVGKAKKSFDRGISEKIVRKVIDLNNEFKGLYLSSGIPGTNLNIHGLSLAARHALSKPIKEGGFVKGAAEVLPMLLSQRVARKKLAQFSQNQIQHALKSGALADPAHFGIATNKHILKRIPGVKQLTELQEELFEKPLFDEFAPALKLSKFFSEEGRLLKAGLKGKKAAEEAGKVSTDLFGGYKSLTKSPGINMGLKLGLLAPDFYKTHFKLFQGIIKGVVKPKTPEYAAYRHFAANLAGATTALDLLNLKMSGKHIWDNDPGYELSLNTGAKGKNGKDVYVSVFGGANDLPRLMLTVVNSAMKHGSGLEEISKFFHNRLSPLGRPIMELIENKDWKGEPYYGNKQFPTRVKSGGKTYSIREKYPVSHTAKKVASQLGQIVQPGWFQGIAGVTTGKMTDEEAWARALELPIRFKTHYTGVKEVQRTQRKPISPTERKRRQELLKSYR